MGNVKARLRRAEERAAEHKQASRSRPTAAELWRHELVAQVDAARKFKHGTLHAHQDILGDSNDVRAASDDVLLEAAGYPDESGWGWLGFITYDLSAFCMLALNWNLPHLRFLDFHAGDTSEDERRWYAARQFVAVMRTRGRDPLERLHALGRRVVKQANCAEDDFIEALRQKRKGAYYLYTCETAVIRPEVLREHNDQNRVMYEGDNRADFLARIRAAQVGVTNPDANILRSSLR